MRRWILHKKLWAYFLTFCLTTILISTYRVKKSDAREYDQTKASRRGTLRKAREGKENFKFKQQRFGVTRSIWIQDESEIRRQFFLEAKRAEGGAAIANKTPSFNEIFHTTKGWLQEELFWEYQGERVERRGSEWVYSNSPNKSLEKAASPTPMQHLRFFDAEQADWNPTSNTLVAHTSNFCVLKIEGHSLPTNLDNANVMARGKAKSLTFSFDSHGHEQVTCQGVQIQLHNKAQA